MYGNTITLLSADVLARSILLARSSFNLAAIVGGTAGLAYAAKPK